MKTYIVDTHYKCLTKELLMSTYNICFIGEYKKTINIVLAEKMFSLELWVLYKSPLLRFIQKESTVSDNKCSWYIFLFLCKFVFT